MNEEIKLTPVEASALTRSGARIAAASRELEAAQAESSALIGKVLQRYDIDPAKVDPQSIWDMEADGDDMLLTMRLPEPPMMATEDEPQALPPKRLDEPRAE